MPQYSILIKIPLYKNIKNEQHTTQFRRKSCRKKRIIRKSYSRLLAKAFVRASNAKKWRSLRKSLGEKEAQNGEIASNYLIPDPKRINKPSDFIFSFFSSAGVWRKNLDCENLCKLKERKKEHQHGAICWRRFLVWNVQLAVIEREFIDFMQIWLEQNFIKGIVAELGA